LELRERSDPDNNWVAEVHHRLRYTAETMGGIAQSNWVELDQERDWRGRVGPVPENTTSHAQYSLASAFLRMILSSSQRRRNTNTDGSAFSAP
ncbi:MAG: hypothetical protein AAFR79_16235, partial [Pseudomonadota bacterium]